MTPLDTELFNEFKRLDKLLREARYTERGVSDYIDEMKAVPYNESHTIPAWQNDLNRLWHCRHIRNKLAHDDIPDNVELSRPEDVEFLRKFYTNVLNGNDPLAQLHRRKKQSRTAPRQRGGPASPAEQGCGCLSATLFLLCGALILCGIPYLIALILLLGTH